MRPDHRARPSHPRHRAILTAASHRRTRHHAPVGRAAHAAPRRSAGRRTTAAPAHHPAHHPARWATHAAAHARHAGSGRRGIETHLTDVDRDGRGGQPDEEGIEFALIDCGSDRERHEVGHEGRWRRRHLFPLERFAVGVDVDPSEEGLIGGAWALRCGGSSPFGVSPSHRRHRHPPGHPRLPFLRHETGMLRLHLAAGASCAGVAIAPRGGHHHAPTPSAPHAHPHSHPPGPFSTGLMHPPDG